MPSRSSTKILVAAVLGMGMVASPARADDAIPELDPVKTISVFKHRADTLAITKDEKRFAVAGKDSDDPNIGKHLVRIFDVKAGKAVADFPSASIGVIPVAFSPNGKQLVFGGNFLGAVNAVTGEIQGRLERAAGGGISEYQVEYSPDGKSIWTFEYQTMIAFDANTLQEIHNFTTQGRRISSFRILPAGKSLAVGYLNAGIRLYSLGKKMKETTLDPGTEKEPDPGDISYGKPLQFAETPDGKSLVVSRFDRPAEFWDLKSGKKVRDFEPVNTRVDAMAILGGSQALVASGAWTTASGEPDFSKEGHPLTVFDLQTGKTLAYLKLQTEQPPGWDVWSMVPSADGKSLYVCVANGTVQVFDVSRWAGTASGKKK